MRTGVSDASPGTRQPCARFREFLRKTTWHARCEEPRHAGDAHVTVLQQRLLEDHAQFTVFCVCLAETAGWDVRTHRGPGGDLVAHFEDWHRLERTMARFGHNLFAIETDLPRA